MFGGAASATDEERKDQSTLQVLEARAGVPEVAEHGAERVTGLRLRELGLAALRQGVEDRQRLLVPVWRPFSARSPPIGMSVKIGRCIRTKPVNYQEILSNRMNFRKSY